MYVTIKEKQYRVKPVYVEMINSLCIGAGFGLTMFLLIQIATKIV